MEIENLKSYNPWADDEEGEGDTEKDELVHIRIQQRNGRKSLTTVQGLAKDLKLSKILKAFKKDFCCNGTIIRESVMGKIIQVQGDQRQNISKFLIEEKICEKSTVKIHGF